MISTWKKNISQHVINMPGWQTDRKIVVIESDDWGMIRMASRKSYEWFLNNGYQVDECPYNQNDAIESNEDLEALFEVLSRVNDRHENPAKFTANNIVANPDFEKIKASGFGEYHYEPFTETLKRYPGRDKVVDLYKQGITQNIFRPQFHGREHLNVNRWMHGLRSGNKVMLDAFDHEMVTVHKSGKISGRRDCLDAFGLGYKNEWVRLQDVIQSGLAIFEDIWGYRASSFIAPCYTWPVEVEDMLAENGVKFIQGTHVQRVPYPSGNQKNKKRYHYQGQKNHNGQRYLIRNVYFEPTENKGEGLVDKTLKEIEVAFTYNKPAIISSHRVNYMGCIRPENRKENLELLERLLKGIVEKFPDVEFMSSDQLGELMIEGE